MVRLIRKSFRHLYKEHRWYIRRQNKILKQKLITNSETNIDFNKYNYSIKRLEQLSNCPIFFKSIELVKRIPHNGCRLKKQYITRKEIKRVNRRRLNR